MSRGVTYGCRFIALVVLFSGSAMLAADAAALSGLIDAQVQAAWEREKISPAPMSGDAEFLRRVHLDLIGVIPTYDEAVAFLADASPDKRSKLIDRLLDDPRYAQHQADVWDLLLFGRNPPNNDADKREGFQNWLREQFQANAPYDQIVRQILRAEGNTVEQGPPMYLVQYRNRPEDATEAITQTFLGVQLQCARCHDHPFEAWKQLDFYGMAAFLARLDVVTVGKKDQLSILAIGEKNSGDILFTGPASQQEPGKKGSPVPAKFLLGDVLQEPPLPEGFKEVKFEQNKAPPPPQFSRKDQLADWIARPENPYFARAVANRVWAQFMGRGVAHPVDNLSDSNKPSHPELLDGLALAMTEQGFDLKAYIRALCNSRTYQLSSAGDVADAMPRWFQQARSRPLSVEELTESWRVATGYDVVEQSSAQKQKSTSRFRPLEGGYVLRFFGQPNNGVGDFQGGLQEHLYLNNGPMGSLIATGKGSLFDALTTSSDPWPERIDRMYLSLLTRPATDDEKQKFVEFLTIEGKPQDRLRDAIWVLMTCSEFRFNH